MKLQNTLFIAAAICFYILCSSQSAAIYEHYMSLLKCFLECKNPGMLESDRGCVEENHICNRSLTLENRIYYCVQSCKPDETCPDENHKCIQPLDIRSSMTYCIQMTDEELDALPHCKSNAECQNSTWCYEVFKKDSSSFRCVKQSDI